ncbi:catechol o methyltransferase [Spathaspora passalidarum NRRL Y-27907]|uniref:catechol O-methyltransferase n=1 Tax=Spathaspora passalidarum (strain NRRL Y-27907 / 11-Y1) TaxID=619300 RepID=G3AVK9_SPAPN|nr:catechol o methyltransferase [Spathaspora passalidarum NRRL Y-27907]EGW29958.1 catechol o methyltransferase [Spathaspora passalidarum NRRL Y-27907]
MTDQSKEEKLAEYVLTHPQVESARGKPREVLRLIEEYDSKTQLEMIIGPHKGQVIIDEIKKVNPKIMIELGCYVGYSAILFASVLPEDSKYYSFELNDKFAAIARKFISLAGLDHKIEIFVGKASDRLPEFRDKIGNVNGKPKAVEFVFIDHWKDVYVPDLRILETLNFIAPGTVIAADNIIYPGVPGYTDYVQGSAEYKKEHNKTNTNKNGAEYVGRWNIVYKSETIEVENPNRHRDGVEISRCVDVLAE